MVLNPDVQLKAQSQLDEVVPKDRLPQFSDRDRLPFITYIVWECLRWHPPVHISLGHYLTEDDEYRSYKLPRGMRPTFLQGAPLLIAISRHNLSSKYLVSWNTAADLQKSD
jgi:cytochrome P450